VDDQVGKRNNSLFFGAIGVMAGVIVAVLVMVLSRPIRPAAIEIRAPFRFRICMNCRRTVW
jgi:hypothetical protein